MYTNLQGLSGIICYTDDILITGAAEVEDLHNLDLIKHLQECNIHVKRKRSVECLGHWIDAEDIHATTNARQSNFLGSTTSYIGSQPGCGLKTVTEFFFKKLHPLKFWFIMTPLPIWNLPCDAWWKWATYFICLPYITVKWKELEKEAHKIHTYLYRHKFTLLTEHKPPLTILGPKKGVPFMVAARLQCWTVNLYSYSFMTYIEFHSTAEHWNPDGLPCSPLLCWRLHTRTIYLHPSTIWKPARDSCSHSNLYRSQVYFYIQSGGHKTFHLNLACIILHKEGGAHCVKWMCAMGNTSGGS